MKAIFIEGYINDYTQIDKLLQKNNSQLSPDDILSGNMKTIQFYKQRQIRRFGRFSYIFSVLTHRVFPKLNPFFHSIYLSLTKGRNQRLSKAEIIGRLIMNGFEIQTLTEDQEGKLFFNVRKKTQPNIDRKPSYWPIFKMKRVGKSGKEIVVYKVRTMHPYSEFAQEYIRQQHGLEKSGKFLNDFRVTSWGRFLRKYWLDELPMTINLIKGDIKIVGVRPISPNFLKLYPEELIQLRNEVKPGLIPPYYADLPGNFEEILQSEEKYLRLYKARPMKTDWNYFFAIARNILFKKARSK